MRKEIQSKSLLPSEISTNRGLLNVFTGKAATPAQTKDLLTAREVGTTKYMNYVEYNILQKPSTTAPLRKHRLLTMAEPARNSKRKMTVREREQRRVEKCLRRRLSWCNRKGNSYQTGLEQYSIYPRAMADSEGIPHKGSKCKWTTKLERTYNLSSASIHHEAVIVDIIFLLQTAPTRGDTIRKYSESLMRWHIMPHYQRGATEVHLIFDRECKVGFNPKQCEQDRRDSTHSQSHSHTHLVELRPNSAAPHPWTDYINCRLCKYKIFEAVQMTYMQTGRASLEGPQKLILAGCQQSGPALDSAWEVSKESMVPQPQPAYTSNADESDCRIWKHVAGTTKTNILIYSPDTDVFNIGLGFDHLLAQKSITVQLNLPNKTQRFIDVNVLVRHLTQDPNLATLPPGRKGLILQTLYITSGCDYVSYFSGFGKAKFFQTFYEHANFICGTVMEGCLSQTQESNREKGFLAFLRLIGTLYFKKYLPAFVTQFGCETPQHLLESVAESGTRRKHETWISEIREVVSERILCEEERMPSTSALERHWKRTCWVSQFWEKSIHSDSKRGLPNPEESGWLRNHAGAFEIDWDSQELQDRVKGTVEFLMKGCSCKKTKCESNRCMCRRQQRSCGPACKCVDCKNKEEYGGEEEEKDSEEKEDSEEGGDSEEDTTSAEESESEEEYTGWVETEIVGFDEEELYEGGF